MHRYGAVDEGWVGGERIVLGGGKGFVFGCLRSLLMDAGAEITGPKYLGERFAILAECGVYFRKVGFHPVEGLLDGSLEGC